jgi:hypothetical protein
MADAFHLQRERRWHDHSAANSLRRRQNRAPTSTTPSTTLSARSGATTRRWQVTQLEATTGPTGAPSKTWIWRAARRMRAAAGSVYLCESWVRWKSGRPGEKAKTRLQHGRQGRGERGKERGRCKGIMALHLSHIHWTGGRASTHAKITPTGGIFGCSNLIISGLESMGPC